MPGVLRVRGKAIVCSRMLTYAHVCSRMLTYAGVLRVRGKVIACGGLHTVLLGQAGEVMPLWIIYNIIYIYIYCMCVCVCMCI